ncbi:unnamed protein product [Tuber melanosporum]|uniref:(Perigord truffle) hypothetical protein n=1 Tax=Tuber melanosporum (strain Mel28) TaxID=656061 RepID=D5GDN9_TUBMM|nr:uncharacterized protein GSTUM_00006205001 [Tuber melanosporum]CAZ82632.1 unnamed protein product [Tuber melanosporum]
MVFWTLSQELDPVCRALAQYSNHLHAAQCAQQLRDVLLVRYAIIPCPSALSSINVYSWCSARISPIE